MQGEGALFVSREALSPGTGPAGLDLGLPALRTVRHSFFSIVYVPQFKVFCPSSPNELSFVIYLQFNFVISG